MPLLPSSAGRAETDADAASVDRRSFLRWVSGIGAAISGLLVGIPVVRSFVSPVLVKPVETGWIKVAEDTALLDVGAPVRVDFVKDQTDAWIESIAQNSVWLYSDDGRTFKAYNAHCTHLGCAYSYDKATTTFVCPCHRGVFDVKTGAVLGGPPPRGLDELKVEVRDSAVFVQYQEFRLGIPEKREA
jgi:menaquinol-cytochrome c reductase iron-sulfur subunit